MKITNLKVTPRQDISKGALASIDVTLDHFLQIKGLTLMTTNGDEWIAVPCRTYEKDGEQKRYNYVYFSRLFHDYLLVLVKKEYLKQSENDVMTQERYMSHQDYERKKEELKREIESPFDKEIDPFEGQNESENKEDDEEIPF